MRLQWTELRQSSPITKSADSFLHGFVLFLNHHCLCDDTVKSRWSFSLDRGGPDAAWPGQDAAVRLDFGRIGAVIPCQMVTVLNGAVTVAKCESVSGRQGTS